MKKNIARILALVVCLCLVASAGIADSAVTEIPSLKIAFSPYADSDQIVTYSTNS